MGNVEIELCFVHTALHTVTKRDGKHLVQLKSCVIHQMCFPCQKVAIRNEQMHFPKVIELCEFLKSFCFVYNEKIILNEICIV